MSEMPIIDSGKCNGCGLCVSVCSLNGLVMIDKVVIVIKTEECEVVKHTFSHYHLFITPTMVQYESYSDKIMEQTENQWYHKDQSDALGLAAPVSAIIESLLKN